MRVVSSGKDGDKEHKKEGSQLENGKGYVRAAWAAQSRSPGLAGDPKQMVGSKKKRSREKERERVTETT